MEVIHYLAMGFGVIFQPLNLLTCFIGVLVGTLVGVLPGIGPVAAISLILPATFKITPVQSIIMLAGIYYGAMYGGSTTSILVNVPGEAASVVTCLDGYQMALQGRAGPALGIAAFGSFIAGTAGVIGLMLLAPPLAEVALKFGPPEYFSLMILGITLVSYLGGGSMIKDFMMATSVSSWEPLVPTSCPESSDSPLVSWSLPRDWGWCPWSWAFSEFPKYC